MTGAGRRWQAGRQPAFLTAVCHCLPQGKQCYGVGKGTASTKQWHTAWERAGLVRNASQTGDSFSE